MGKIEMAMKLNWIDTKDNLHNIGEHRVERTVYRLELISQRECIGR